MATQLAVEIDGVTKRYGPTVALDEASLAVRHGHVHALLGENGAGKSTTVKVLSGLVTPDAGSVRVFGEPVTLRSPREAHRNGIQTAFQELTLVPDLTVTQNLHLPYAPANRLGLLRSRQARRRVEGELARLSLDDVDPRAEVRDLDLPTRQKLEIAKAVLRDPRILLLDEPTSALTGSNVEWLERIVRMLADDGVTMIFITHRMQEVRSFCESLSVFRDGRCVGAGAVADYDDNAIVELMLGRSMEQSFPPRSEPPARGDAPALISVDGLSVDSRLSRASVDVHAGEVVGVAALQGMGQVPLYRALFGMEHVDEGAIRIEGREVELASPRDAIRSRVGISYLPEDRKTEGLLLPMTGTANVSLPLLERFARFGWLDKRTETAAVRRVLERVNVDPRALHTRCSAFSGGNQQKIVLAKWLLTDSRVMLMFDPTRGIDVGTKLEIFELMHEFAAAGGGVLFHSTDTAELVNVAHRVIVLYRGRVVRELVGEEITEQALLEAELGYFSEDGQNTSGEDNGSRTHDGAAFA
ncbi:Ribose import ATP-binding protein RbsA [wastewater metagenome]|uniref:Ribose import ATP-binding protein RbsA n=2 Tax=unclassified sequences TaxID=12908 RepID=A0A5B8RCI9_9ZZZZ|nr:MULTISPECIES: sugar ABC transporter ATP-binding protein [Arhodomonas]MCS4502579.1 sugar ABC transporter ATP-binding protein [Arhodomonas aquaeolei]QEA04407.1 ribose import ATP-binding protein RbsA [uncultured organism]